MPSVLHTFARVLPLMCMCAFLMVGVSTKAHAADSSDFLSDMQGSKQGSIVAAANQEIRTSWDEFGMSIIVDGRSTPSDITRQIAREIVNDMRRQDAYIRLDNSYLEANGFSRQDILRAEGDGGNDLLPQDAIEPNPSFEANPEANAISSEDVGSSEKSAAQSGAAPESNDFPAPLIPESGTWSPVQENALETVIDASTLAPAPTDAATDSPEASAPAAEEAPPT